MAIIKSYLTPITLDGLNQEIVFGPGYIDLNISDCNTLYVQLFTSVVSTWQIQTQQSIDGTNWVNLSVSAGTGTFGPTYTTSGATFSNILSCGVFCRPYFKLIMNAYTSGEVTMTAAVSVDQPAS